MKIYLSALLMMLCAHAFAATSKWVDENGKVHYSDQPPPPNVTAKILRSSPVASESGTAADETASPPQTAIEREAELKRSQQEQREAADKLAQEQAQLARKKESCAGAQQNLRTLQDGIRIVDVRENGERYYINDEQRQQRTRQAQQDIATFCN
ncbi:MAG: DUF4124 domain-containing protein [Pseudomonadota bacterium]